MILDYHCLEKLGYRVVEQLSPVKMSMQAISENIFSYFEDYEKMGFVFIDFPDQIVVITNEADKKFSIFGKCLHGFFAIDNNNNVVLLANSNDFYVDKIVYVNDSLSKFLQCYSLFMSEIFILKSNVFNEDKLIEYAHDSSDKLVKKLSKLEAKATTEDSFWALMLYTIEDLSIKLNHTITFYIDSGRL